MGKLEGDNRWNERLFYAGGSERKEKYNVGGFKLQQVVYILMAFKVKIKEWNVVTSMMRPQERRRPKIGNRESSSH
jgi:hypothetical protein